MSIGGALAVIYNLPGGPNAAAPTRGPLTISGDTLYGATQSGGIFTDQYGIGSGTIFSVKTNGTGFNVVHSFNSSTDGAQPYGGLIISGNTLYGTTTLGAGGGRGTVFSIGTDGSSFKVLYTFTATTSSSPFVNNDRATPETPLMLWGDTLYGTTFVGGSNGWVFAINTNGTNFKVVHAFDGANGKYPSTQLVLIGDGLYRCTYNGGSNDGGTIFAVNTNGNPFRALLYFDSTDSSRHPDGDLALSGNKLYGTTLASVQNNHGTAFSFELPAAPTISADPQSITVTYGFPADFAVTVSGWPPFAYQWAFNGNYVPDATNAGFSVENVFPRDVGLYSVTITNLYGSTTSNPAMLTAVPSVLESPKALPGGGFQFSFDSASNVSYTIQYSPTLNDWTTLAIFRGGGGPITIIDPAAVGAQRFYRVVLSP